jgi:hypothetical protein
MAVIEVFGISGDNNSKLEITTGFPVERRQSIIVAVDPTSLLDVMHLAWGRKVYQSKWRFENQVHDLFFVIPRMLRGRLHVMEMTKDWKSTSPESESLYPWWENIPLAGVDIICQIHPQGCSSYHYHAPEEGIAIAETYWPVINDGYTMLRVNGQKAQPLQTRRDILPNQEHQLIRNQPGFSIHLLMMYSRRYRFPSRDGHCPYQHTDA